MTPISMSDAAHILAEKACDGRVFIPGGPVEPLALYTALRTTPDLARDLRFCGMMIPGINIHDWASLHPTASADVFLPAPDLAATIKSGQTKVIPVHYSAAFRYLCAKPFKAAVFHVCPPDQNGACNLSLSADSSPALIDRDIFKLGLINHALPPILGAPCVNISIFDAVVEIDQAPAAIAPPPPNAAISRIATHVAALVENGATLQAGIGKLPAAIMKALAGHKDLRVHSGLIGDWALDLMAGDAISYAPTPLTAGVILGSQALHVALSHDRRLRLAPINMTHDGATLSAITGFTSINAALEIDLFGQINCEYAGARTIAGVGGALDFLRGARASHGGKPIIMIACEGKGGVSRIVPRLTTPTVSIARSDAPILVTEHGSVDLEPLDTHARARAIINLAGEAHRDALSKAWHEMG